MAPHITRVHIKDALIVKEPGGPGHKACISGQGDMPFKALLTHLICPGDDEPQVTAYGPKKRLITMRRRSALKTKMIIRGSLIAR